MLAALDVDEIELDTDYGSLSVLDRASKTISTTDRSGRCPGRGNGAGARRRDAGVEVCRAAAAFSAGRIGDLVIGGPPGSALHLGHVAGDPERAGADGIVPDRPPPDGAPLRLHALALGVGPGVQLHRQAVHARHPRARTHVVGRPDRFVAGRDVGASTSISASDIAEAEVVEAAPQASRSATMRPARDNLPGISSTRTSRKATTSGRPIRRAWTRSSARPVHRNQCAHPTVVRLCEQLNAAGSVCLWNLVKNHLNDRDGRTAEYPVLRAMAIKRDVVWPKADQRLSATKVEKPPLGCRVRPTRCAMRVAFDRPQVPARHSGRGDPFRPSPA